MAKSKKIETALLCILLLAGTTGGWCESEDDKRQDAKREQTRIDEKNLEDARVQQQQLDSQLEDRRLDQKRVDDSIQQRKLDNQRWERSHGRF